MNLTQFEIQQMIGELIDNVDFPKSKAGRSYRFAAYQTWAGETLILFIFYNTDYAESILFEDVYYLAETFRDHVAMYQTYGQKAREIFSAALSIVDDFLEVLDNARP